MDRETTTLTIGEHNFVVKTYTTARELNAIQSVLYKGTKVEVVGQAAALKDFDMSVKYLMYVEMIRQVVVSMDGTTDGIVDRCEDLPSDAFDALMNAIDAELAKKKS